MHVPRMQDLKEVVPWGRSFAEYVRFFGLSPDDIAGRILDCGGGPASFTAEAIERGHNVIACDPIYRFNAEQIEERVNEVYPVMLEGMRSERERFVWTYTGSPEEIAQRRIDAMRRFLADLPSGLAAGRYVAVGLPKLPFEDDTFDLGLSSHFLFLYSDQLSLEFHLDGVAELMRVARELRAYPLMAMDGRHSPFVEPVMQTARARGWKADLVPIEFEFQRGANRMLSIKRE